MSNFTTIDGYVGNSMVPHIGGDRRNSEAELAIRANYPNIGGETPASREAAAIAIAQLNMGVEPIVSDTDSMV